MLNLWQALEARKKELAAKDNDLRATEEERRALQKANRPSRDIAEEHGQSQKKRAPQRQRTRKIYGASRARYALDVEKAILEQLENRKTEIAQRGFAATIEIIRGLRIALQPSTREKTPARRMADKIAIREIVDEICDRWRAQFGEKATRTDQSQDWSENQLRAFLRQRMALLRAGLEALKKDRSPIAQDIRDQDHGRMALYERLYYSSRLQSQETFGVFVNYLRSDPLVAPRACNPEAYRRGWEAALDECLHLRAPR